ncbi:hypothetical protein PEBR_24563 [Penicillium brasilianum]|uniref:MYND-type domain-containing protein n=1 Tax=Penicillium brasilianum TaxID=104259 RepID=A0A1S9RJ68_PENBI|nr:hypothetical protein PEBR_24563 [Penicillium brasilianum]
MLFIRRRNLPSLNWGADMYAMALEELERLDAWDSPMLDPLWDLPTLPDITEDLMSLVGEEDFPTSAVDEEKDLEGRSYSFSEGSQAPLSPDDSALNPSPDPEPRSMDPLDLDLNLQVRPVLLSGCAICPKQDGLIDCGTCRAMTYCSDEHLLLDRPSHEKICKPIQAARESAEEWRLKLESCSTQPFRRNLGHLHLIPEAQPYLAELSNLIALHEPIRHRTAVEGQLVWACHVMYMSAIDSNGYRFKVPALMMRINRDQECYDFMKWHANQTGEPVHKTAFDYLSCRFGNPIIIDPIIPNPRKSFVGYKQEDIFESIKVFKPETPIMTLIPLCLVKIRFLFDIQRLNLAIRVFGNKLDGEVFDLVLKNVPFTKQIAENEALTKSAVARFEAMKTLLGQALQLYRKVKGMNPLVWKGMVWSMRGDIQWPGEEHTLEEEMKAQVKMNWESWIETPGAIALLERIMIEAGDL